MYQIVGSFLTHIETSLGHLVGVDTPVGRVPAPKIWVKLSKYMGEGEVSISASIKGPCTKFCLEVYDTKRNISYYLGGVDTLVGRVPALKIKPRLSKYMGREEVNISASIRAPCTKYI